MTKSNDHLLPLGKLPVFFDVSGKSCVIAGDNDDALPKARLLLAAGAKVSLFITGPSADLLQLAETSPTLIHLHRRSIRPDELDGAVLAIGAYANDKAATEFADLAHQRHVPVNMVDRPALCDFHIPSIVNRSPLIIAISTGGIAPVIGQWLRGRIEILLPSDTGNILKIAAHLRAQILKRLPIPSARRNFWRRVAEDDLPHLSGRDETEITDRLLSRLQQIEDDGDQAGSLHRLVVSDDPDQLTLAQLRQLQSADMVICLDGVQPLYIDFARRDAARSAGQSPDQARPRALEAARSGLSVVWLAGPGAQADDPALHKACEKAGIRYENKR